MRLYAFQPKGHGELSFFVMAESEGAARAAVDAYIEGRKNEHPDFSDWWEWLADGWGTDYYRLTVAEAGQVIVNSND